MATCRSILCGRRNTFAHRRQIVLLFTIHGDMLVNSVWQAQYFCAPTPDCMVIYSTWRVVDLEGHFGGSKSIYCKRYAHPAEANWRLGIFPDSSSPLSLRLVAESSRIEGSWSANLCITQSIPRLSPPQEHLT